MGARRRRASAPADRPGGRGRGTARRVNGVACEQVWPAGTPRPRQSRVRIEYLLAGSLVAYGVIAFLVGLVGYFR